ncbi:hypothetical protein [Salinisphaera sp. LB1]|uniref:hypothetical protein n=1 Tax=Salinisphaera sp. LB1 TaxID=2183911 RepID=UPI000D7E2D8C|nr:hypothetical protein [Salinisphaera sp. LB1]AWN17686.1 hypothetical protein SALB1_3492 [Salinisphaera sp. LB1]
MKQEQYQNKMIEQDEHKNKNEFELDKKVQQAIEERFRHRDKEMIEHDQKEDDK